MHTMVLRALLAGLLVIGISACGDDAGAFAPSAELSLQGFAVPQEVPNAPPMLKADLRETTPLVGVAELRP